MEKLIIFYDDAKAGCCRCAEKLAQYDHVECRKASDYREKSLIFATGAKIGLLFESENGRVPYGISHIIWRMTADKKKEHMILVTGGSRELKAIRTARRDMEKRGYNVRDIYTRYMLEKNRLSEEDAIEWVINDVETGETGTQIKTRFRNLSKKELRKELRREIKAYRRFQKDHQK